MRHRTYLLEVFFEANDFAVSRCFCRTGILPFAYSPAASALFGAFLYSATFCEIAIELWSRYFLTFFFRYQSFALHSGCPAASRRDFAASMAFSFAAVWSACSTEVLHIVALTVLLRQPPIWTSA